MILGVVIYNIGQVVWEYFRFILGDYKLSSLTIYAMFSIEVSLFVIGLSLLFWPLLNEFLIKTNKGANLWLILTIFLTIFVILFGILSTTAVFDARPLNLKLRDSDGIQKGTIECTGRFSQPFTGIIRVGDIVTCKVNSTFENTTIKFVQFNYINGSLSTSDMSNFTFVAPSDVRYLGFKVYGYNTNEELIELGAGWSYHFLSEQEYNDIVNRVLTYSIGVFIAGLISVPTAIDTLRRIAERK